MKTNIHHNNRRVQELLKFKSKTLINFALITIKT